MYCTDCKNNTNKLSSHKQIYYCFGRAWNTLFVPILNTPQIIKLRRFIIEHILETLSIPEFMENGYKYNKEFLNELNELKSNDDKIDLIDSKAWGKFAFTQSDEDIKTYNIVSLDKYDDYKSLGHYLYLHECQLVAVFIWTLCNSIWPLRPWIIVQNNEHAFVMCKDDPYTIYDILWSAIGIPANKIDLENIQIYDHPMQYYMQCRYGLDPNKSESELMEDIKVDADENGGEYAEERFNNRIKYELPVVLAFKSIYE